VNRWQRLLSLVGAAITLSTITGVLVNFFESVALVNQHFNSFVGGLLLSKTGAAVSSATLTSIKVFLLLAAVWTIFYAAAHRYARAYEQSSLFEWIYERRCFLRRSSDHEVIITAALFFVMTPVLALLAVALPPWYSQKLIHFRDLHLRLWPYLVEVAFLFAMIGAASMILSILFRSLSA
jgi:hypothetical protein